MTDHHLLAQSLKALLDIVSPQVEMLDDEQLSALLGGKRKIMLSTEEGKLLKRTLEASLAAISELEMEQLHFELNEDTGLFVAA